MGRGRRRQTADLQGVPLATKPGFSLIILPLMRILQRNLKRITDTILFIQRTYSCSNFFAVSSLVLELLTLNIPSLARQRCLPSWGHRRTPWFFFVISQLFDAVDYSNYVFLGF